LARLPGPLPELEALYTDVHAHPELSMQETRTASLAAERLRAAGYDVTTAIGKTGVVGLLRNGAGPSVMLRADMDALPVEEATACPMPARSESRTVTVAGAVLCFGLRFIAIRRGWHPSCRRRTRATDHKSACAEGSEG
jgi:hypothetical protein